MTLDELAALLEEAAAHPDRPDAKRLIAAMWNLPVPLTGVTAQEFVRGVRPLDGDIADWPAP